MKKKSWILVFLGISTVFIISIYFINFIVSPYKDNSYISQEYKPRTNERTYQFYNVLKKSNQKFDGFIIGSSKVMNLKPSRSNSLKNYYNFWSSAMLNKEKLYIVKEIIKKHNPKKIIIGIDFFNFNMEIDNDYKSTFNISLYLKEYDVGNLSLSKFINSIKVILNVLKEKKESIFLEDGTLELIATEENIREGKYDFSDISLTGKGKKRFFKYYKKDLFSYNEKAIDIYQEIYELAKNNGINILFVLPPVHPIALDLIEEDIKIFGYYKRFKNELKNKFPNNVLDLQIRSELMKDNKLWYDTWHYRPVLGDKLIKCIYLGNIDCLN